MNCRQIESRLFVENVPIQTFWHFHLELLSDLHYKRAKSQIYLRNTQKDYFFNPMWKSSYKKHLRNESLSITWIYLYMKFHLIFLILKADNYIMYFYLTENISSHKTREAIKSDLYKFDFLLKLSQWFNSLW